MGDIVLRTAGLVMHYGKVRVLDGLRPVSRTRQSVWVPRPERGGKTTTIHILLNLLRPDAGHAEVLGVTAQNVGGAELRARIGYLPGDLRLNGGQTTRMLLKHMANVRGGADTTGIEALAARFGLELDRRFRSLSKGTTKKAVSFRPLCTSRCCSS